MTGGGARRRHANIRGSLNHAGEGRNMTKWTLLLTTLPYVAVVIGVKMVLEHVFSWPGIISFGDVAVVLTVGAFLIGFMLSGTMADYKESEKIPGEVASILETLEDSLTSAAAAKPEALNLDYLRGRVLTIADTLVRWLQREIPQVELFAALHDFTAVSRELDKVGAGHYGGRVLGETHNLRKIVTRIAVISRTNFLDSGYALLETVALAVLVLLELVKFSSTLGEFSILIAVPLLYVYMVRLIRDIDDPFEYSTEGKTGSAEIELFPIFEYRERLRERVGDAAAHRAVA
jgi:hypothetical protein